MSINYKLPKSNHFNNRIYRHVFPNTLLKTDVAYKGNLYKLSRTFLTTRISFYQKNTFSMFSGVLKSSTKYVPALNHGGSNVIHLPKLASEIARAGQGYTGFKIESFIKGKDPKLKI
jgi:hypothetical protein